LINNSWDPDEPNPKKTYDKILVAIPKIAEDTVGLMEEYAGIRRRNFDSFQKFLDRLQYLKNRLKSIDIDMGPKAHLWIALIAVKDDYKENYLLWCRDMKNNTLTWNSLMEEFSAIEGRHQHLPQAQESQYTRARDDSVHPSHTQAHANKREAYIQT
jgi:hypothetical protein